MAKKPELPAYTFAIAAELRLVYDKDGGVVWEVTTLAPLVIAEDVSHGPNHLPAGTVLYLPVGQMEVVRPAAIALASAASDEIAEGERIGTLYEDDVASPLDSLPF